MQKQVKTKTAVCELCGATQEHFQDDRGAPSTAHTMIVVSEWCADYVPHRKPHNNRIYWDFCSYGCLAAWATERHLEGVTNVEHE